MDIKYRKSVGALTVYVGGELDEFSASKAKDILDNLLYEHAGSDKIIFDLSDVSFMDSTGVGLLIGRYKKISALHKPVYISGASPAADRVLTLAGIYSIMPKI